MLGQEFRREEEWLEELSDAELKIGVTELNTRGPDADKSQDPNIPPFALVGPGEFNELS